MGSNGSKSAERRAASYAAEREKRKKIEEELKLREAEEAAWKAREALEKHHREQRLREEESLKRNREAWLRGEENLTEKQRLAEILRQQEIRTQRLLREKKRCEERRGGAHREILAVEKNVPCSAAAPIASRPSAAPNDRTNEVTNKIKCEPRVKKTITNSKVPSPSPVISSPKTSSSSSSSSSETYRALYASAEFPFVEWTETDYIREKHGVSKYVAENIIAMFDRDTAIPFIARYRKNVTLGMDADRLTSAKESLRLARLLKQRADSFIEKAHRRGICNSQLYALARGTKSPSDLDLTENRFYSTKPRLEEAARHGLLLPARAILRGEDRVRLSDCATSDLDDFDGEEKVREAVVSLTADIICKEPKILKYVRVLVEKYPASIATDEYRGDDEKNVKTRSKSGKKMDYRGYYNFSATAKSLRAAQILEIDRGERQKMLNVRVILPRRFEKDFKEYCEREYEDARRASSPRRANILSAALDSAWKETIEPDIWNATRRELTRRAETELVADMAKIAKRLLLVQPVRNKTIVGIRPGSKGGCALAVVSGDDGRVLHCETIHPCDAANPLAKQEAELVLAGIIVRHECSAVALGDGPASRETEIFLTDLMERPELRRLGIEYAVVETAPAAFYASSRRSSTDLPFLEAKFKEAVSLARRLRDPMDELVKIEPRRWTAQFSRHNLPAERSNARLNAAIEEAVSLVGVDVNAGSLSLLSRVAGLNESRAKNLIKRRESSGPFVTRNDLRKVEGMTDEIFEQCAGFLKIIPATALGGGGDPPSSSSSSRAISFDGFDQTCIHPEMYELAEAFLRSIGCDRAVLDRHLGTPSFVTKVSNAVNLQGYAALAGKYCTSVDTIEIIVEGLLTERDSDARDKKPAPRNLDDVIIGAVYVGIVRADARFGWFVDVGLEYDGLMHKSKTGGVSPHVGQRVETRVIEFQKERRRLGLALVKRRL